MTGVTITPASGSVGAYVDGVHLSSADERQREQIVSAWHQHGVLFFRDQHLSPAEQAAAASIFGTATNFDFAPPVDEAEPTVHRIGADAGRRQGGSSTWHSDATWMERPPRGSMLQALSLPAVGGDTLFASASLAYEYLSEPIRAMIVDMTAAHHGGRTLRRAAGRVGAQVPDEAVDHPIVRRHRVTAASCLYVNRLFTSHLNGVSLRESEVLLPLLCDQFTHPEIQCRFTWQPGDVAVWDNCLVQHYATPDYDEARSMQRVVFEGDPVIGNVR